MCVRVLSYSGFVGYGGGVGWAGVAGAVMRPAPGYLSDWQYSYSGVPPAYSAYNAPYYNSYSHPPPAHHQQVSHCRNLVRSK